MFVASRMRVLSASVLVGLILRVTCDSHVQPEMSNYHHSQPPESTERLASVVRGLRSQLRDSKTKTRSALNMLEEKVQSCEADMSSMKDQISQFRTQQNLEQETILKLVAKIDDLTWGQAELKREWEQLRADQQSTKRVFHERDSDWSVDKNRESDWSVDKSSQNYKGSKDSASKSDLKASRDSKGNSNSKVLLNKSSVAFKNASKSVAVDSDEAPAANLSSPKDEDVKSVVVRLPDNWKSAFTSNRSLTLVQNVTVTPTTNNKLTVTIQLVNPDSNPIAMNVTEYSSTACSDQHQQQAAAKLGDTVEMLKQRLVEYEARVTRVEAGEQQCDNRVRQLEDQMTADEALLKQSATHVAQSEKTSVMHESQLDAISRELFRNSDRLDQHDADLARMDSALVRLKKLFDSQMKRTDAMESDVKNYGALVTDVTLLQREVFNFITVLPRDCSQIPASELSNDHSSSTRLVRPGKAMRTALVTCQSVTSVSQSPAAASLWTVIQRRGWQPSGSHVIQFYRPWEDYKYGFGLPNGDHWLGNENLYVLTSHSPYSLRVDLWDLQGVYRYAEYSTFRVASERDGYRLTATGYYGNATDALGYSSGAMFSTLDVDNDNSSAHCAKYYGGGWWYRHCHYANLNGARNNTMVWFSRTDNIWMLLHRAQMLIRPLQLTDENDD